jgi:hypothetical protein
VDFSEGFVNSFDELNLSNERTETTETKNIYHEFLIWAVSHCPLKLAIFENLETFNNKKFYRFAIKGTANDGSSYEGFGASENKTQAAVIAVMETIERFVRRNIFNQGKAKSKFRVSISNGQIQTIANPLNEKFALPAKGLQSSNGWALHFDLHSAIQNAARESLERHILLSTYIEHGWAGFKYHPPIKAKDVILKPAVACLSVGGFSAGMVLTTGPNIKGCTIGYLCDSTVSIIDSSRWVKAFLESYSQWLDLTSHPKPSSLNPLRLAQWHNFETPLPEFNSLSPIPQKSIDALSGHLLIINVQKVFKTPFPLYAAFVYGEDLLPLVFKSKLSADELKSFESQLQRLGITQTLPEVHPIL